MVRLFFIILLVAAGGVATFLLAKLPGSVTIDAFGTQVQLPLVLSILLLLVVGGAVALFWGAFVGLWRLPGKIGKSRQMSRVKKANLALTDGLLAAEAGDVSVATKLARKAADHAEDERLKVLLEARAAESAGDWSGAERAWAQLARLPGGQLAGLRGTAMAAMERGDPSTAETSAREALALKSGADWPFNSLFDLQVARGDWKQALETLELGERRKLIKGDPVKRRRAVLHTAYAVSLPNGERAEAQKALADAIRSAPDFPPAAWHGARQLLLDKKDKPAMNVLTLGWKARPHPAFVQLVRQLSLGEEEAVTNKRLRSLIEANPEHYESKVLEAELAMTDGDWVAAVKTLALLVEATPTGRLCLLMERALTGYGDKTEAARWARMAVTASREADWSDLEPKGGAFAYDAADWARLVYKFGDAGQLVHPRHEAFAKELDVARALTALPAPEDETGTKPNVKLPPGEMAQPIDYVPED
jgi:HemY protein